MVLQNDNFFNPIQTSLDKSITHHGNFRAALLSHVVVRAEVQGPASHVRLQLRLAAFPSHSMRRERKNTGEQTAREGKKEGAKRVKQQHATRSNMVKPGQRNPPPTSRCHLPSLPEGARTMGAEVNRIWGSLLPAVLHWRISRQSVMVIHSFIDRVRLP